MSVLGETPTNRKVYRDRRDDNAHILIGLKTPIVDVNAVPVSTNVNARNVLPKGKIATDRSDCCLYLADGQKWNFVGGCSNKNSVRIGLSTSINNVTKGTLVDWDLIESDPAGMYSTITNLITIPQAGVYEISSTLCLTDASSGATFAGLGMRINAKAGNFFKSVQPVVYKTSDPDFTSVVLHKQLSLAAGYTIGLELESSGPTFTLFGGVDAEIGAANRSWASVRRIG